MLTYFGVVEKGWYSGLFRILYLGWRTLLLLEWWKRAGTMYTVRYIVPGMEGPVACIGVVEKGWSNVLFRTLYLECRTLLPMLEWWRRAGTNCLEYCTLDGGPCCLYWSGGEGLE